MKSILIFLIIVSAFEPLLAQSSVIGEKFQLMPIPAVFQLGTGRLLIDPSFSIGISGRADPILLRAAERFLADLRWKTGMLPLDMKMADAGNAVLVVHVDHETNGLLQLGEDESYSLNITMTGAQLSAATTWGAMHGLQTFLQLVTTGPDGFQVPVATIQDSPRFPWRGLMIDAARHFMPIEVLKRNLDGMAAVKMNVFHWHLSDNQGFRVESKKFPKLQELGSDGFFYTQDEVRELVAYARDRGIRVVPEFDMPAIVPHGLSVIRNWPAVRAHMRLSANGEFLIRRWILRRGAPINSWMHLSAR
jgi:hexosaminidase